MQIKLKPISFIVFVIALSQTQLAHADATGLGYAPLKQDIPYVFVVHQGRSIKVVRDIENSFRAQIDIRGELMQTSGACPPFCLLPINLESNVKTVAESEIIDFLLTSVRDNTGVLVDVRSKKQYSASTIPGSVNLFIQDLIKANEDNDLDEILLSLGAIKRNKIGILERFGIGKNELKTKSWDFSEAKNLIIWSTSAAEPTPIKTIEILLSLGYPTSKVMWYRGGLAAWQYWGFTTISDLKKR